MGENDTNTTNEGNLHVEKNDGLVEKKDAITGQTSNDLVNNNTSNLRQFADVTITVLEDTLGMPFDVVEDMNDHGGNLVFNLNKQGVPFETPDELLPLSCADGQIKLTVLKNGKINLRLTVYGENPDEIYYHAEGLGSKDFVKEIPNLGSFLSTGVIPGTSTLKKDSLRGKYEEPGDLEAMIAFNEAKRNKKA